MVNFYVPVVVEKMDGIKSKFLDTLLTSNRKL